MYTARTLNINVLRCNDSLRINGTFLLVKNRYPEHHVSINLLCTTAPRVLPTASGREGAMRMTILRRIRHSCRRYRAIQRCSRTRYNTVAAAASGCTARLLHYPPQPIRGHRETNEEQKLTIMPQNFMPCTQSFSCANFFHRGSPIPACDTPSLLLFLLSATRVTPSEIKAVRTHEYRVCGGLSIYICIYIFCFTTRTRLMNKTGCSPSHNPLTWRRGRDGFRLEILGSTVSVSLPSPKIRRTTSLSPCDFA